MALITESYKAQQIKLHENPNYGVASVGFAPAVYQMLQLTMSPRLLDYGAGKGRLGETLKKLGYSGQIEHYDPAREQWSKTPEPCEFVACIDVLEHVEPACLNDVLDDLARVSPQYGYFTVHTGAAGKLLDDGRNAHLIQEPLGWWLPEFEARFSIFQINMFASGFSVMTH